jgi:hypothetical protein
MDFGTILTAAIDGLLNENSKLTNVLLRVQALAGLMENPDLLALVEHELNGYYGEGVSVPDYRRIAASPRADFTTRFGQHWQYDQLIGTDYLEDQELHDGLTHRYLSQGVAALEDLVEKAGKRDTLTIEMPKSLCQYLNKQLYTQGQWLIHKAWQLISINDIAGVVTAIRSKLITLLIGLRAKFGSYIPLQSLQQKQAVNESVNQALKSLHVTGNVNILGAHASQSTTTTASENAAISIAQGAHIVQTVSTEQAQSLTELVAKLKYTLASDPIFNANREELTSELERIDQQLQRPEPKKTILERSFKALHDLVKDSIGSTAGHVAFELLKQAPLLLAAGEHIARHS